MSSRGTRGTGTARGTGRATPRTGTRTTTRGRSSVRSRRPTARPTPPRAERRQAVVLAIVCAIATLFAGRLVYVQAIAGPTFADAAAQARRLPPVRAAPRGDTVGPDGEVLATSVTTDALVLDLAQVPTYPPKDEAGEVIGRGAAALAQQLAPILGRDPNVL